jgi:modulator of FtsH protease HflK
VRNVGPPSEIGRLAAPAARLLDAAWQRMHWWIGLMVLLYALSGITVVKPDEVAVVLRWGRLVGETPAMQEHGPGLLFCLPRPIDRVVRVPVKHVWEVPVTTLGNTAPIDPEEMSPSGSPTTLDPTRQGYALTGDQNIVHVQVMARYHVREAAEYAFYGPKADDILRVEVTAAMVRSLGEMGVDRVLADGRKNLIATAMTRAQKGLDAARSGLELSSLELTRLAPPAAVAGDFEAVQSAFIGAETKRKDAQSYAETVIPQAQGDANTKTQGARGAAESSLATARGNAQAFLALAREYRANPVVVRERLYRDALDRALAVAMIRWVPPPVNGRYNGFRISLQPSGGGPMAPSGDPEDK